jgi:predicted AAA+ superfamily ATPase
LIQNIKDWEIFIRRINEKEKVKIFITGSSSKLLSDEIATSLRGRTISYPLYPLNFREFLSFKGEILKKDFEYTEKRFKIKKYLEEYLEWGSFPEIALEKDFILKRKILSEYFELLVYRDLKDRFSIENTALIKDLLKSLFTNISSYFSVNSYFKVTAQRMPLSRQTLSYYLSCLEETQYFSFLPIFAYSLKVQRVNPKKIICLDNGLRSTVAFKFSQDRGKLTENLVGLTLQMRGEHKEIFYWKNRGEVDFVVKENNQLSAINVCFSNVIPDREIKSLLEFKEEFQNVKNLILLTEDLQKEENGIKFIPLWKWLIY